MKKIIVYAIMLSAGIGMAAAVGGLISLLFPLVGKIVFVILSLWWLKTGWDHACMMDRAAKMGKPTDESGNEENRADSN